MQHLESYPDMATRNSPTRLTV